MKSVQFTYPSCSSYQSKISALHKRVKSFTDPDMKRTQAALVEAACLYANESRGPLYRQLFEEHDLRAISSRADQGLFAARTSMVDIRVWREARITAGVTSRLVGTDFKTRELVCLSLLTLKDLSDETLVGLLQNIPFQKREISIQYPGLKLAN